MLSGVDVWYKISVNIQKFQPLQNQITILKAYNFYIEFIFSHNYVKLVLNLVFSSDSKKHFSTERRFSYKIVYWLSIELWFGKPSKIKCYHYWFDFWPLLAILKFHLSTQIELKQIFSKWSQKYIHCLLFSNFVKIRKSIKPMLILTTKLRILVEL